MTYNKLKALILEGAPTEKLKKEARKAMKHHSYTSLSFGITNALRLSRLSAEQQENMVVGASLNFYESDLPRWRDNGSFAKKK